MIEAVNSVLVTAPATRNVEEQVSTTNSFAANPERVQVVAQAPFVSPYIRVDVNYDKAVLQIRDGDTGDVVRQFPSESQLQAYRRAADAQKQTQALEEVRVSIASQESNSPEAPKAAPIQTATPDPAPVVISTQERVAPTPAAQVSVAIDTEA